MCQLKDTTLDMTLDIIFGASWISVPPILSHLAGPSSKPGDSDYYGEQHVVVGGAACISQSGQNLWKANTWTMRCIVPMGKRLSLVVMFARHRWLCLLEGLSFQPIETHLIRLGPCPSQYSDGNKINGYSGNAASLLCTTTFYMIWRFLNIAFAFPGMRIELM
jgi:hypothetical protein